MRYFILCTNNINKYNGTYSHCYEIGLYLQDVGLNVCFLSISNEKNNYVYDIKYNNHIPIFNMIDFLYNDIKEYCIILYAFYKHLSYFMIPFLSKAKHIFYLITDSAISIKDDISFIIPYLNKITFLYDVDLLNPIENEKIFQYVSKKECSWGIYDKYYRITHEECNDYFIYARHNDKKTNINYSYIDKINEATQYCKENNISYVLDTKKCFDPWNKYKGLIYTRNVDYSPRLPFEFGIANKHTICFDTSPGLRTLANDCTLYKSIIMKTRKELYISL